MNAPEETTPRKLAASRIDWDHIAERAERHRLLVRGFKNRLPHTRLGNWLLDLMLTMAVRWRDEAREEVRSAKHDADAGRGRR